MFKKSIRRKLMILLMAATIIPIAVSMYITDENTKKSVTDKSIHENLNLLSLGATNIVNYMDTINRGSLDVYNFLNKPQSLYSIIERGNALQADWEMYDKLNAQQIHGHLLNIYQSMKEFHQIYFQIYGRNNFSYLLASSLFRGDIQSADQPTLYTKYPTSEPFVEPTHISHSYGIPGSNYIPIKNVFTLHRPIIRTPSDEVIGFISLDVDPAVLFKLIDQLTLADEESIYVIDRSSNLIYSQNSQLNQFGQSIDTAWAKRITTANCANDFIEWEDDSFSGIFIYDTMTTQYMDWIIVKGLPYTYLYENAQTIIKINTLIIAVCLIVVILATMFISYQFTKPIRQLIHSVNKVHAGNLQVDIQIKGEDEISVLARRFNSMISRIDDLINREYKLEIANKTNQLKAMQAQINPHFMNNTLQSIGTMALQNGSTELYSLISSLANMMRYNMNTSEPIVPFIAELTHAQSFLALQKQRFGDNLKVSYDVAKETHHIRVPKMILQPLLENYFKHGYEPSENPGEIHIQAMIDTAEQRLIIQVRDNGCGVDKKKLAELRSLLAHTKDGGSAGEHIGLSNVFMRLLLYYPDSATMSVHSQELHGFMVRLEIPLEGENNSL